MTQKVIDQLIEMGAREWAKGDRHRLYLGDAGAALVGLTCTRYKSGAISSAQLHGETTTNANASRILCVLDAAYYDMVAGEWIISKPAGVKEHDFNGIRSMLLDAIEALAAEADAEPADDATVTYYSVDTDTMAWERELPGDVVDRLWRESDTEQTGRAAYVHEVIYQATDYPARGAWDDEQVIPYMYRKGDTWYSIPEAYRSMTLHIVGEADDQEDEAW